MISARKSRRCGPAARMPALLDNIRVDYHGTPMPVNQLGTITAPDATMIVISPWDPERRAADRQSDPHLRSRPESDQ